MKTPLFYLGADSANSNVFVKHDRIKRFLSDEKETLFSVAICTQGLNENDLELVKHYGDLIVYASNGGFLFLKAQKTKGYIFVSADWKSLVISSKYCIEDYSLDLLLNIFRIRLLQDGNICIHGAAIVNNNEGIVFCGLSTAGKSTQASLWRDYFGSWVLNYDKPALIMKDDCAYVCGTPWSGKEWCIINRMIPLKALVFVIKANDDSVRKLSIVEAISRMYPNFMVFPVTKDIEILYENVIAFWAEQITVYEIQCTKTEDAVKTLFEYIYNEDYLKAKQKNNGGIMMKRNDNFILRDIAGEHILIPRGSTAIDYNATVLVNDVGASIWTLLQNDCSMGTLIQQIITEYDVDEVTARSDIASFLEQLNNEKMLESYEI